MRARRTAGGGVPVRVRAGVLTLVVAGGGLLLAACAPGPDPTVGTDGALPEASGTPRPGSAVAAVDFLYAYENRPSELYYPIEGLGGCEFSPEGTLIFTDEKRGKVYGRDGNTRTWYEFDSPTSRPYQPVDAAVDGFKVLVLDRGSGQVNRHDLSGAFLDVLVDIRRVDPVIQTSPSAFGVDRDGRMALADQAQQQVLLLDTFQNLTMRVGDPGSLRDQFTDPSGLTFLPDGSFLVADRGNRRLAHYGRMGFFEANFGGDNVPRNPFLAPEGLDCDRHGNVFVADSGLGVVHVLGQRLNYAFSFGGPQDGAGETVAPVDVSVGPDDRLAVTDRGRSAVLIYRIVYN
ncbi:hypothetical protein KDM41_05585 [bacterium]|nr:hypothetical protein [bacterium]